MSATTGVDVSHIADELHSLAAQVEELEGTECEECAKREAQMGSLDEWYEDSYERLIELIADVKRGVRDLDELYLEADV